ncbi:MAG: S46 family peptidase [Pirellulaceae bacterium]|nr:S46 family peptidase [Pirellulaceae bacterium]
MRSLRIISSVCVALLTWSALAPRGWSDEGMYPLSEIGGLNLAARGLEIPTDQIFNPRATCLLDGICRVNGCTGSFVSANGLIITNHHCAYGAIQSASTTEHDYLANGFQAQTYNQEISATGYTVRITEAYSDISDKVLSAVTPSMSFLERTKAIERRRKELEKEAETNHAGMRAEVAEMFAGKTYVLFLYTYLKDVRLVFAPPASVGNFGGEVDNWEWPRHTGDFSFMRAYTAPDGSSADYSTNNVPYKPKRFIQVASQGADEGDFVFILGYPGRTARHKTASFLDYEEQIRLPYIARLYAWQIATLEAAGKDDRAVALKLASQIRSLANVEKRARGQLKGLDRAAIATMRKRQEAELQKFIDSDPARQAKYGTTLKEIDAVYKELTQSSDFELNIENLQSASRTLAIAFTLVDAAHERIKEDLEREAAYMDRNFDQTAKTLQLTVQDLHVPVDKIILTGMLERLAKVPGAVQLPALSGLINDADSVAPKASALLEHTRLNDWAFVEKCLKMTPFELVESQEPVLKLMTALYPTYLKLRQRGKERAGQLDKSYGELVEVKQQFMSQSFIPDANATLRMTFGRIRSYSPEDGVIKTPITTLKGVIDKTTGEDPFITPQRIRDLYAAKDFGPFVHKKLGQVPVAILYDTDTTGGNSGSPVLNARGQLVGVNFDRAFEATINDFAWNASYSRSIGVDIRYCLWITGKVYGAEHLLKEMGVSQ